MRKHRVLAVILAAVMLLGTIPAVLAASVTTSGGLELDKTASALNTQRETKIDLTVSAPAAVADGPVAVEFVLDGTYSMFKHTAPTADNPDKLLIEAWAEAIREQFVDKNVYVGVTVFGNDAYYKDVGGRKQTLYPISKLTSSSTFATDVASLEAIQWLLVHEGTNVQAGIQSGIKELESLGSAVAPANRYLVLITDGGSYWRMNGSGTAAINDTLNGTPLQNSDAVELKGLPSAGNFGELMKVAENVIAPTQVINYGSLAEAMGSGYTNFEKGVYAAAKELDNIGNKANLITVGYPYYKDTAGLGQLTALAQGFIDYAGTRKNSVGLYDAYKQDGITKTEETTQAMIDKAVAWIAARIGTRVALAAGSTITDVIGSGTDNLNEAYNFDLVTDKAITLTINGTTYTGSRNGNTWTFGDGSTLVYTPGDNEQFVLTLGQALRSGQKLVLSYTAKLTNPSSKNDTHTVYPNKEAYLTPNGGSRVDFPRPALEYKPGSSSSGSGSPILNTEDHFSYIIGFSDGTVRPYGYITRGQAVTIFFRLLKDEIREEYWCQTNDYSDVPANMWCNNAISTLTNMGIIDGFKDGTFRPNARVTRAQFAKMAVGFFETTKEEYQGIFSDVPANAWYTEYVEAAARVGLIGGFNDGTYRPNTPITRAQACVIMNRALGRKPDKEHLLDEEVMVTWVDNTPDDWFYADMQEATNSHDYEWVTVKNEIMENWTAKLPQRDWAALEHEWSTANSAPGGEVIG